MRRGPLPTMVVLPQRREWARQERKRTFSGENNIAAKVAEYGRLLTWLVHCSYPGRIHELLLRSIFSRPLGSIKTP